MPLGVYPDGRTAAPFHLDLLHEIAQNGVGRLTSMDVQTAKALLRRHVTTVGHRRHRAKLETTGWAVIFGRSVHKEIRTALSPLIEHRRKQTPAEIFNDNLEPPRRKTKTSAGRMPARWKIQSAGKRQR